jgi:hypothetical protein
MNTFYYRDSPTPIPVKEYEARLTKVTALTHDIRVLEVDLDKPLKFWAGQYVDLTIVGAASLSPGAGSDCTVGADGFFLPRLIHGAESRDRLKTARRRSPGHVSNYPTALGGRRGSSNSGRAGRLTSPCLSSRV